jgi:hypothetical protein
MSVVIYAFAALNAENSRIYMNQQIVLTILGILALKSI